MEFITRFDKKQFICYNTKYITNEVLYGVNNR